MPIYMYETNKKILEDAFEWLRMVYKNWETGGGLPKHPWTQKNAACKECPVRDACWNKLGEGTIKIKKMELPTL